jgi:peptide-methionine (S)-S-oxide reductase
LKLNGSKGEELATFGAGCYWGTEKYIVTKLQETYKNAIYGHAVGFMSPNLDAVENPKYRAVCSGTTTHVEVLHFKFNNTIISYEELVKYLFTFHDPTTMNMQG